MEAGEFESRPAATLAGRTLSGSGSCCSRRGQLLWAVQTKVGGGAEEAWMLGLHSRGAAGELVTGLSHAAFSYVPVYIVPITEHRSQLRSLLNST